LTNAPKIETTTVPYDLFGQKMEEPQMSTHIWDLLTEFNDIDIMADDDTHETLYMESFDPITKNDLLEGWKDAEVKFREQTLRFELEMSRINLDLERDKQASEKKALEKEKDQFANERDRFLEGLGPRFSNQINNILEDINSTAEAAHAPKIQELPRNSMLKPDKSPIKNDPRKLTPNKLPVVQDIGPTLTVKSSDKTQLSPRSAMRLNQPYDFYNDERASDIKKPRNDVKRSVSSPRENLSKISKNSGPATSSFHNQKKITMSAGVNLCTLCKGSYQSNQLILLRGKPFCPRCKDRLLEGAKQRGMNI